MRSTSKSFANQFGITQKNLSKNPSQGIGLNPNLNIEDEYIENLLKQVHFLNMEIKLIKQKQKQNKGMGIMGLLNKDTNPVVTHAISSNDKFTQMRQKLDGMVNTAQVEFLRIDDENYAAKAQKDYLERLHLKEQQTNFQNKKAVQTELNDGISKLKENQSRLQELRTEAKKVIDVYNSLKKQFEQLSLKDKSKQLLKKIIDNLETETQNLSNKHHSTNQSKFNLHKAKLDEADIKYKQDPKFVQLLNENGKLKQSLKQSQKQLFDMNYKVKQYEQLKKLAIRNKDVESQSKKQASEETQRLKKKLNYKKGQFEARVTEGKNGLQTNEDIRMMKGKIARKDKQINDIKKKTQISQANYKKLRDEVMRLEIQLTQRKQANAERQNKIAKNAAQLNNVNNQLSTCESNFQKQQNELTTAQKQLNHSRGILQGLEQQLAYLSAKEDHLNKSIDMDEGIRQVKVEQLTNLIQSNLGLNNTINDLMGKWEQIIRFSRQPPTN